MFKNLLKIPKVSTLASQVLKGVEFIGASGKKETGTLALSGTANVGDVVKGKTFYKDNAQSKLTGTFVPNYQGYKIVTGSKTVSACLSSGFIPLVVSVSYGYGHTGNPSGNKNWYAYLDATINGSKKSYQMRTVYQLTTEVQMQFTGNEHIDLEIAFASSDWTALKKLTALTTSSSGNFANTVPTISMSVIKWLQPI